MNTGRHTGGKQWDADRHNHHNPTDVKPASDGGLSRMMSAERLAWLEAFRKQQELRETVVSEYDADQRAAAR